MTKIVLYLILLCLGTSTIVASEVYYIIKPSQSQNCGDQCSNNAEFESDSVDNSLTLSQFANNSINYLTNDTRLIFSPGNYSMELELIAENIDSFSMFALPISSTKAVIVCGHNARFVFRNVSIVTVSGLEFVGCFENHVVSIGRFQLEDSSFFGNDQEIVSGTVLTIVESTANLDRVAFVSIVDKRLRTVQELSENCYSYCTATTDRVTGISLKRSTIGITHSWFEGSKVVFGGIIYDEFGSDITITNTTFVNNIASDLCFTACHYCYFDGNITSGIVYANSYGSTVNIYDTRFVQNVGVAIFGDNCNMLITHTKFINNKYSRHFATIYATDANLVISHSSFTNSRRVLGARNTNIIYISHSEFVSNNGFTTMCVYGGMITSIDHSKFTNNRRVLGARNTNIYISHSEFVSNNGFTTMYVYGGMITSIDHSKFTNNTQVLDAGNTNIISITHSEFVGNTVTGSLVNIDGVMITVSLSEFVNNRASDIVHIRYYTTAENLTATNNVFINNSAAYEVRVISDCRPGLSLSLGSPHCIQCTDLHWYRNLIGIVITAFIAGIVLVIFMLALNMTVAIGTLNGILFYANIVSANADTYFLPFTSPDFVTVFISWLNLDIGFDVCFFKFVENERLAVCPYPIYKALIQLTFPAYVILLVIIVIVASECSSKFAKIIGKGNPVAVLATLVLLSYVKFFNVIVTSASLMYQQPAYGSRNLDLTS